MRARMRRPFAITLALSLLACNSESELQEDPPYAVDGVQLNPQPTAPQPGLPVTTAPPTFNPELRVDDQPVPAPPMPQMPPGQLPPGMQPGQIPPGQVPPGQVPPGQVPPMQPGQVPPPGQMPVGGPTALSTGFQPDPAILRGSTTGQMNAVTVFPAVTCTNAFIAAQPNHIVQLQTGFNHLRILVNGSADTVLVIRTADGTMLCNDDSAGSFNPTVEATFGPGPISIYVGTYQQGATASYVLGLTEIPSVTHAMLGP
jgi:hypothetical protein